MGTFESGWTRKRISDRQPIADHTGESGAQLEHAVLNEATPVILKTFTCDNDVMMRMTGDTGRAAELVVNGSLDRLPPSITHSVLDAWPHETGWVLVMEDVGEGLIPLDRVPVATADLERIVTAAAQLHAAYWQTAPDGLVPVRRRMELMNPTFLRSRGETEARLPAWILDGWEAFWDLVDDDVAAAVAAIHDDPDSLARRLATDGVTMLHGDLWLQNVALLDDRVAFIDWALATAGPVAVEWAYFLGVNHWQLECTHDEVLELILAAEGPRLNADTMDVALLWGLSSYGWNKAWHVANNDDEPVRTREKADLSWWTQRARLTLETWSPT